MSEHAAAAKVIEWLQRPIRSLLDDPRLTDLHINGVGEGQAFVDRGRGMEQITLPYSYRQLEDLALYTAAYTGQDLSAAFPIATTKFPGGQRVQIILPPAVGDGKIAISIRQPKQETPTPEQLERDGVFDETENAALTNPGQDAELQHLLDTRKWRLFLERAVAFGKNIVFSGPVGTGKTHDLRAFTHCIPRGTRIITIEDADEMINLPHANVVHLFYSKGGQSITNVNPEDLVEATKRMGMGCILNQELRDDGAYSFFDVLESGHHGMTTTHARNAKETRLRIKSLIKKHPTGMHQKDDDIMASLHRCIDVVAYCEREGNKRRIKEILYEPRREAA